MALSERGVVFLSASVPVRQPYVEDARPADIEEAIVSIARAVFARGGRMLFGGHPSVSPLIASVAGAYFPPNPDRPPPERPIVTFQSEFFRRHLPDETWALHRMGWSVIEWTPNVNDSREQSLEVMRHAMLGVPGISDDYLSRNALRPATVMFAVGGMEGIRDEADILLHQSAWHTPIYAVTSGGGAARRLVEELPEVRHLEREFLEANAQHLPRDMAYLPYAAMAQWLLDNL